MVAVELRPADHAYGKTGSSALLLASCSGGENPVSLLFRETKHQDAAEALKIYHLLSILFSAVTAFQTWAQRLFSSQLLTVSAGSKSNAHISSKALRRACEIQVKAGADCCASAVGLPQTGPSRQSSRLRLMKIFGGGGASDVDPQPSISCLLLGRLSSVASLAQSRD